MAEFARRDDWVAYYPSGLAAFHATLATLQRLYGYGSIQAGFSGDQLKIFRWSGSGKLLRLRLDGCVPIIAKPHLSKARRAIAKLNVNERRVRELLAWGSHTEEEWQAVLIKHGGKCLRCGSARNLTRDHVRPLVRRGTHDIGNIQPLCNRCNSWKATREIDFRPDSPNYIFKRKLHDDSGPQHPGVLSPPGLPG